MCILLGGWDLAQEVGCIQQRGADLCPLSLYKMETWGKRGSQSSVRAEELQSDGEGKWDLLAWQDDEGNHRTTELRLERPSSPTISPCL